MCCTALGLWACLARSYQLQTRAQCFGLMCRRLMFTRGTQSHLLVQVGVCHTQCLFFLTVTSLLDIVHTISSMKSDDFSKTGSGQSNRELRNRGRVFVYQGRSSSTITRARRRRCGLLLRVIRIRTVRLARCAISMTSLVAVREGASCLRPAWTARPVVVRQ